MIGKMIAAAPYLMLAASADIWVMTILAARKMAPEGDRFVPWVAFQHVLAAVTALSGVALFMAGAA